jgi:hypothetical protein
VNNTGERRNNNAAGLSILLTLLKRNRNRLSTAVCDAGDSLSYDQPKNP